MAEVSVGQLIELMINKRASDLHLRVPSPPVLRIEGVLVPQNDLPIMTAENIERIFEVIASPQQVKNFLREQELDFSYGIPGIARLRVNVLRQRGTLSIAFRLVQFKIPTIDELELPPILKELVLMPRGLILLTGHTGTGKSTTMAAMIDHLNKTVRRNIVTIEDPIEFLHHNEKCIIAQRDLGDDTKSFAAALRHVLRHDPDVIVIGEMRDLETISTALTAAEMGHLVLGTLHTTDAPQTIDRIIDIFPSNQQHQITIQLSQAIGAVLCQTLLPRIGGGRIAAFEIMIANSAVRNLIRDNKIYQLPNVIQLSSKEGMQTLNQALAYLVKSQIVAEEKAIAKSSDPSELAKLLHGTGVKGTGTPRVTGELVGQSVK